jgi:hypothetical protein
MAHTGHCLCGSVTIKAESDPVLARICWCRDCQYIASGSATVNVLFASEHLQVTGSVRTYRMVADSGNTVERGFCDTCGAQIYSRSPDAGHLPTRVRAGILDNPDLLAPRAIIWASRAPSWAMLDPNLPHHAEGPDSPVIHEPQ